MRILLVSEEIALPSMGGLAKHVMTLARALVRAGYEVDLLGGNQYPIKVVGEEGQFGGRFFGELHGHLSGWKERKLGMFLPPKRPWIARKMAKCIMARASDYDVIHYHGHFPNISKYIPTTVNFVQTRHDQGGDCLKHTRFRDGEICNRLDPADCADCIALHPNTMQRAISTVAVRISRRDVVAAFKRHKTIFVSDMLRRSFSRVAGAGEWGVVVHNFVDLEQIQLISSLMSSPEITDEQVLKVFVASMLYNLKGIEILLQNVVPVMPVTMQVIIAGNGPDEQRLRQMYESIKVKFLGWCDYATVISYMNACHALIVPSICEESCATTVLEGLAIGKPIYALDRGGTPELSVYERYPGQLKLFANMEELVANLVQLKTKSSNRVCESFAGDVSNCISSLLEIYQSNTSYQY